MQYAVRESKEGPVQQLLRVRGAGETSSTAPAATYDHAPHLTLQSLDLPGTSSSKPPSLALLLPGTITILRLSFHLPRLPPPGVPDSRTLPLEPPIPGGSIPRNSQFQATTTSRIFQLQATAAWSLHQQASVPLPPGAPRLVRTRLPEKTRPSHLLRPPRGPYLTALWTHYVMDSQDNTHTFSQTPAKHLLSGNCYGEAELARTKTPRKKKNPSALP